MLFDVDDRDLLAHLRVRTQQLLRELAAAPGQAAVRAGKQLRRQLLSTSTGTTKSGTAKIGKAQLLKMLHLQTG